jgi:ferric-dicitrate binding protein FerR (iron transport regulator)
MNTEKSYKLLGCCTRKVLIEKYFSTQKKIEWVVFKKEEARKQNNQKAVERWKQLERYHYDFPEKFERMINTIRNEVK